MPGKSKRITIQAEKLLDALRVNDGYRGIFFPNNGGREGFQMYFVALIANLGAGFSFNALKLASRTPPATLLYLAAFYNLLDDLSCRFAFSTACSVSFGLIEKQPLIGVARGHSLAFTAKQYLL